ncbi:MAG: hypothetical protein ACMXYM_03240 [Candidatus Woesearchaeota archaeon]
MLFLARTLFSILVTTFIRIPFAVVFILILVVIVAVAPDAAVLAWLGPELHARGPSMITSIFNWMLIITSLISMLFGVFGLRIRIVWKTAMTAALVLSVPFM